MAIEAVDVPFKEAIAHHKAKVSIPTEAWTDLYGAAHARAFTVAGAARDALLGDLRIAVEKAIVQGVSFNEFQKDFDAAVERHGWSHTGTREWRARLIYQTNIQTAYQAGRWVQIMDPDIVRMRPHLRYRHSGSKHPRPEHLSWNNLVLPRDDPFWKTHYPPNGWGCGCWVEPITDRQLARLQADPKNQVKREAPQDGTYTWTDPRTGDRREIPRGIDPGWDYNVGEASQGVVPPELAQPLPDYGEPSTLPDLPPLPPIRPVDPARLLPEGLSEDEYVDRFLAEFGASQRLGREHRDPSGGVILIDRELFVQRDQAGQEVALKATKRGRERYLLLLADAIRDPDEIWVDWAGTASGTPALRRTYLRRAGLPDGRELFAYFSWAARGWEGVTAYDTKGSYLARQRRGALLYRRPDLPDETDPPTE
ncbi:PBECR2 nuclease fold domain-containing protein (plasmid) [Tistrella mobilis]|uniref:PBECR2 nuclease fold domain-containing protein n=1 Tax=Tistrella mobilis TaxID=171437 RepID=UPI003557D161